MTVRRRYEAMARSGGIEPDATQFALADKLDLLIRELGRPSRKSGNGALAWIRARRGDNAPSPRGLYVWGPVGRGKTLLMDIFFAAAPVKAKRRVHFHAFMGEVHERIAAYRRRSKSEDKGAPDPIAAVAKEIASETTLLCFDEFAVHDIADAMILGRLLEKLFKRGLVVVATSNVAPDELYKDGLNRALFLPFVALLKERMAVFHLDAPRDYRLDTTGTERRYATPLGSEADACLDAHFRHFSGGARAARVELHHKGHRIVVPQAAAGVARFAFEDICGNPLSAGDYLKITDAFSTVIVAGIPILSAGRRNEVKRLINLVDTFYDRRVRLIVSAEAEPAELWQGKDGAETFEFARTASRLIEMRSDSYWESAGAQAPPTKKAQAVKPGPLE
jgi:cell division protein ZapE